MTRVEKNATVEERLSEVKGEVVRELKRERRRFRPFLTCGAIFLLTLVCLCVWVCWTLAETGLVEVPFFTSIAYEEPAPIRVVEPGVPVETVLSAQMSGALASRLQQGNGALNDRSVVFSIGEESLTASLRSIAEQSGTNLIDASRAQLAIEKGRGFELFAPIEGNPRGSAFVAWMEVGVKEGVVSIVPINIRVGSCRVPSFIVNTFLRPLIAQELKSIQRELSRVAVIKSVEAFDGLMRIEAEFIVEIQEDGL
jgi:hypothetical protein